MKRALLVGQDDARGLLAAARALGAAGWGVGVVTPHRRSLVAASRHVQRWHPLGHDVVVTVARAVAEGGYDVVLPGGDEELVALSEHRERLGCAFPYGSHESVCQVLDKMALAAAGPEHGVDVPLTSLVQPGDLGPVSEAVVLKSRSHAEGRSETLVSDDAEELRESADAMLDDGAQPVLQPRLDGTLVALTLILGPGHELLTAGQQRALALWPPQAGITVRGRSEPVDTDLLERTVSLLTAMGWAGLVEAQFLDTADGMWLIDVNGRCYGSLALAEAAGIRLTETWAEAFTGGSAPTATPRAGVRYHWMYGDLRRAVRERSGLAGTLAFATGARHSVLDRHDLRPALAYLAELGRAARRR